MVRGSPNPLHFGLPARLRKARKQSGLKPAALALRVGRDTKLVANLEANERIPTVGTVARLASGLHISAGWLGFGIGEPVPQGTASSTDGMSARLAAARATHGLTKAALARLADLSPSAFAKIENGGQTGVDVLAALAKALGVSPAWLAYGEGPQGLPSRRRARTAAAITDAADLR